jgi:predicted enzyme involved in methoxymalonyl-ACP biosynthesis
LTGIVSVQADGDVARIVDFVLSCRVMGRRIEETMVHLAVATARDLSLPRVVADLVPTKKNAPCLEFWQQRSGFQRDGDTHFTWDAHQEYALPGVVSLERVS